METGYRLLRQGRLNGEGPLPGARVWLVRSAPSSALKEAPESHTPCCCRIPNPFEMTAFFSGQAQPEAEEHMATDGHHTGSLGKWTYFRDTTGSS